MACVTCNDGCCFIDYKCIVKNTPLNTFADEEDVMQSLLLAQEDVKNDILKDDCYDELCAAVGALPDTPLTPDMEALKNAIMLPLAWKTFKWWLFWYSNVTFSDSASETVTDRTGSAYSNIDDKRKEKLIIQAESRYMLFKAQAIDKVKDLKLDCSEDECVKTCGDDEEIDDCLSHLPEVV